VSTSTDASTTPTGGRDQAPDRRQPLALVLAALVAVVVVALVLVLGVARPPQLPTVADDPQVTAPARLATHGWEDGESCVTVVEVDGRTSRPWCSDGGAELIGWSDRGLVLWSYGATGRFEWIVDPADGEVVATEPVHEAGYRDPPAPMVSDAHTAGRDGQLEVRSDDGTLLWRTDAPDSYRVTGGWPSPDGRWVALIDNADRLLLVPADGSMEPRIWATGVGGRYEVAWEGATPTSRG
jgi:hypothetical protein